MHIPWSACSDLYINHVFNSSHVPQLYTHTHMHTFMRANSQPLTHTVGAKLNLSAHLLLISDDMSDAKWEIWISFLCRQSLIHWQKAQMWEDDFSNLDPSRSTRSGSHVLLRTRGGCTVCVWMDRGMLDQTMGRGGKVDIKCTVWLSEFKVHLIDVRGYQRFSV